jgi:putative NADPH-quinone reductase
VKKILLIMGHPDKESFGNALADAYESGARESGAEFQRLNLADLDFEVNLKRGYKEMQELEPDLKKAQKLIIWAEHLVFVYPIWWITMPALLKGFLDRTFLPGFAFKYKKDSPWWDKLLAGRTGRMITTMDAPVFYYWLANWNSGHRAMKKGTLEFCGIKPVKVTTFGQVKNSTPEKREKWLEKVRDLGRGGN